MTIDYSKTVVTTVDIIVSYVVLNSKITTGELLFVLLLLLLLLFKSLFCHGLGELYSCGSFLP